MFCNVFLSFLCELVKGLHKTLALRGTVIPINKCYQNLPIKGFKMLSLELIVFYLFAAINEKLAKKSFTYSIVSKVG